MVMSTVMRICLHTTRSWSLLWQDILDQKSRERGYTLMLIVFCNILADNSPLIVPIIEGLKDKQLYCELYRTSPVWLTSLQYH
jgi:hypothetical protein